VDQRAQTNFSIVHERAAVRGKRGLRRLVARARATRASETTFFASGAIDPRFEVEERARIEQVRPLTAAPDVADRRCHSEKRGERHGYAAPPSFGPTGQEAVDAFLHGSTS
jgi:hypothetical protein